MLIVVAGMIGTGKTTLSKMIGEHFGTTVYYEDVTDNKILPLFYTASEEVKQAKRYPFLLQLEFLGSRYKDIKKGMTEDNSVLDRSIYEDWYFAKVNTELGNISETEFEIYEKLLDNMMEELDGLPKKRPDLMVYLTGSFETVLHRIGIRGRDFEQDPQLIEYYRKLWEGYDEWVHRHYKASQVLTINIEEYDLLNKSHAELVMRAIEGRVSNL